MTISTKANYGLRILIQLGKNGRESSMQLKQIAENEKLSLKYLEKVVQILKISGFVNVTRGAKGGYKLEKDAANICLKSIYIALEGSLTISEPVEKSSGHSLWTGLSKTIAHFLGSQSLQDLIDNESNNNMYYI